MKKLALFLMMILLTSVAVFTFGQNRAFLREDSVRYLSGCGGPKQEATSNDVQVRLEICGDSHDGYDIDAANPSTGEKFDCAYKFTLTGQTKEKEVATSISRERTITVSATSKGWFNAFGESGMKDDESRPVKNLKISSFTVTCSK